MTERSRTTQTITVNTNASNTLRGNSLPNKVTRGMRMLAASGSLTWLRLARPAAGANSSQGLRRPQPIRLAATEVNSKVVRTSGTLR